jgi:hypothetical protein
MMCFPMLIHKIDKVCKYVINHKLVFGRRFWSAPTVFSKCVLQ